MIFVCLQADLQQYPLADLIVRYCGSARIVALDADTKGQAQSVLAAQSLLDEEKPLVIYNCDTYMEGPINQAIAAKAKTTDGIIAVFQSKDDSLSYVDVDAQGFVKRVAEKEVISPYATTGLYYFSRAELFIRAAREAIACEETINGEYYVAPLYNKLIEKGHRFAVSEASFCYPLGTPEQLAMFQQAYNEKM
jgi:NDP-sugar pyrophosphorylase family protein